MKKRLSILPLLLSLLLWTSCSDPKSVTDSLDRAEAWLNEHPDSAWTMLNTIPVDEMGQNRNRARYALLYTQAQDKNYIDETNDSLITVAVDYYRHTDDVRRQFLSYYYKGRVLSNAGDYLKATSCYMEAEQLANAVEDNYLTGLLYAEMGRIYRLYYDYPKSLEAYQKAAECYERARKTHHRNYMWLNQSSIYRNVNDYIQSERLLREALMSARAEEDNTLVKSCLGNLIMLYIEEKRMMEAKELYEELRLESGDYEGTASFKGLLAQMYASIDEFPEARGLIEQGWACAEEKMDSVNLYVSSAAIYKLQGKGDMAYQELLKGLALQKEEVLQALQQPVLTIQRDYLSEKLEFERYRLQEEKRLKLLYVMFFLLVFSFAIYVFIFLFKKYKKKSRQTISDLKRKSKQIEEEKGKIAAAFQRLDKERIIAQQTIKTLDDAIAQKEKSRERMETLMLDMEADRKSYEEAVNCLRAELRTLQSENNKIAFQITGLLKSYLEQIVEVVLLCEESNWDKEKRTKRINDGISLLKKNYFAGEGEFRKVETLVNMYLGNVMVYFRKEVNLPKESDYRRVCYMFAGLSGQLIGHIMNESKDVVYQRRKRLLQKLELLSCPHKEMFVLLLCK